MAKNIRYDPLILEIQLLERDKTKSDPEPFRFAAQSSAHDSDEAVNMEFRLFSL